MVGQSISHYKITDKLGAGGMGVVYKALDLKLERTVALKFLPTDVAVSDRDRQSLLREARSASALDHPNIGVIHGIEESEDHRLFIVMGYYEGETLAQKLSRGVIPVHESLDLAIQIARGLSSAHARNIVHRDVKPSNIIITNEKVAKIVDFGLARVVATASATQSISSTGTLPYMAPEQILGEAIDQRCDIWALGVILIQMVTGSHPFVRPNQGAMTYAILNQPPVALDVVPQAVQPVAYRALSKKAEGRYPGADEMLRDLEASLAEITSSPAPDGEPTLTSSINARDLKQYIENASTPSWSVGKPGKARRLLLASAGVVLAAIAASFLPPLRERLAGLAYAGSERHIAVLPFSNSGNDPEYGPIAEGLMDSLTNELSNLEAAQQSLWVVPASVVRNRKVHDPTSAFRELGATVVVEGSVRRKGPGAHLTVVLIDSKRLRQVGSTELDDPSGDLAALQRQAVTDLARLLKIKVTQAAHTPAGSVVPSAYESYLKALAYLQRYDKPGNADLAISALNSAIEKDPRFALGYATLGEAYRLKFLMDHHPAWVDQALANCRRALEIDDRFPAVRVTLGQLQLTLGKNDLALQEFQKALDINPRDSGALIGLAGVYEQMGHIADAEANFKRSIALRPDYWEGYSVLGAEYMELKDSESYAAAEAALQKSIQLAPNYQAYANLGWLYLDQKRYAQAAAATRQALELNDQDWRVWANLLLAYTWLKDGEKMRPARAKALSLLEQYALLNSQEAPVQSMLSMFYAEDRLREKALAHANAAFVLAPKNPWVLADIAETYDDLGDRKRAIQYARDSLTNGYTLTDLQQRPALLGLLADPSFRPRGKQ